MINISTKRKEKKLLLEKILDVEGEITHDRKHDNINIFKRERLKAVPSRHGTRN